MLDSNIRISQDIIRMSGHAFWSLREYFRDFGVLALNVFVFGSEWVKVGWVRKLTITLWVKSYIDILIEFVDSTFSARPRSD